MNIYIRADIEKDLRKLPKGKSMSGLINRLLADYFEGGDKIKPKKVEKIEVPEKNIEYKFEEYMEL